MFAGLRTVRSAGHPPHLAGGRQVLGLRELQQDRPEGRMMQPLDSKRLTVTRAKKLKDKPEPDSIGFGKYFTDHMLRVAWMSEWGWGSPKIEPFANLQLHPAAKVLHYATELFEGLKAFRGTEDDRIRLFRPMHNMQRMNVSAQRACLPTFDGVELLNCIRELVDMDREWVPRSESTSLYIRPTLIATEAALGLDAPNEVALYVIIGPAGPYFTMGSKSSVNLLADPKFVRSWPGGCGYAKMGSNYGPTIWVSQQAARFGCQQVLWLFGEDKEITEVGATNIFMFFDRGDGKRELVTPPLDSKGLILAGVTRRSILELTEEWGEFEVAERKVTLDEVLEARKAGQLSEMFCAGTAAIVCPVGGIYYQGKMLEVPTPENGIATKILAAMNHIYYRDPKHPWMVDIDDWKIDGSAKLKDYPPLQEYNP